MKQQEMQQEIDRWRKRAEAAEAALERIHRESELAPWIDTPPGIPMLEACPYRDLIDSLNAIVLFVDTEGVIHYANSFAAAFFACLPVELTGSRLEEIFPDSMNCSGAEDCACASMRYLSDECPLTDSHGRVTWISWACREVRSGEGALIGEVVIGTDITEEREAQERLMGHQSSLRSLTSQLGIAEERERRRIAERIHEEICQNLAFAKLRISGIDGCTGNCLSVVGEVQSLLDAAIDGTRTLAFELSPPMLWDLGFEDAVEWLVERTNAHPGISCDFTDDGSEKPLMRDTSVTLFRAVRQLLAELISDPLARHATVRIARGNGEVEVCVEHDGAGIDLAEGASGQELEDGFGLFNIRERMEHLGGEMTVSSERGNDTSVVLHVPLEADG